MEDGSPRALGWMRATSSQMFHCRWQAPATSSSMSHSKTHRLSTRRCPTNGPAQHHPHPPRIRGRPGHPDANRGRRRGHAGGDGYVGGGRPLIVDSYRFLPRSFRPFYEGKGPFSGEEAPVWAPFEKRLQASRIALLSSAGLYLKASQPSFDLTREQDNPEWGDPSWRPIPSSATASDIR